MLKISLVIGDAEAIRSALTEVQIDMYDKTKAIAAHCPTRFAITLKISQDVMATRAALVSMVTSDTDRWKELAKCSTNSGVFDKLKDGKLQPVCR